MIKVAQFDLSEQKDHQKYEEILNRAAEGDVEIIDERIGHSEGYFYIFLKYRE